MNNGREITVRYSLFLTMVDGKAINSITGTSSAQRCYLCGETISNFNNIDAMRNKSVLHQSYLEHGISSLHAWIRCFEMFLRIAYRIDFCEWRISSKNSSLFEIQKRRIQKEFRARLGLIVDKPKPGGAGNSNDGNTARRFFENVDISAEITGIDKDVMVRMKNILIAVSCGMEIEGDKFREYCYETAQMYILLYGWYYMPTTVHKLLIHGHEIISYSVLPIGIMSEDAQESRNKDIARYRENFSRKSSRVNTNTDIFNRMIITSDPLIAALSGKPRKPTKPLPIDVRNMMVKYDNEDTAE